MIQARRPHDAQRGADQVLVVRRDRDIRALLDERFQSADVVRAHRFELAKRDRLRLDVDPLADAHVVESRDVRERAPQVCLQHDADVLVTVRAQLAIELQGAVGRRRVLHVDAHEVPARRGVARERLQVLPDKLLVELEPEARQLDGDVRIEALLVDPREHERDHLAHVADADDLALQAILLASFPFAFSLRTTRIASSSVGPAM